MMRESGPVKLRWALGGTQASRTLATVGVSPVGNPALGLVARFATVVNLETISTCNARCVFCPHPLNNKNANPQYMDEQLFRKIIDECVQYAELREICFGLMNEPMMDRLLLERIAYVRRARGARPLPVIVVITNGALLTPSKLDDMLDNPPDGIKVSVHGLEKETYERAMVGLNFDKTMRNLEYLAERLRNRSRPRVMISTVYTDDVARQGYETMRRFWAEKGFAFTLINVENRAGTLMDRMAALTSQRWTVRDWCKRPLKQLNILPNGDVVLCCADWRGEVIVGNARTQSLYEIWHGEVLNHYRARLRAGEVADLRPCNRCMQAEIVIDGRAFRNF